MLCFFQVLLEVLVFRVHLADLAQLVFLVQWAPLVYQAPKVHRVYPVEPVLEQLVSQAGQEFKDFQEPQVRRARLVQRDLLEVRVVLVDRVCALSTVICFNV